ncbi:uncharacterized protein LOC126769533 isoform X4 [Nymphalis io]|uniref:uncharacterized protein LOC126769533 isoform X4 n=1 Tax=Inachis io TaxID=171585 RepID=UPI0021690699|nr:uncharacterized protein LOC126769533 isoform X4 [Nymphalis io]
MLFQIISVMFLLQCSIAKRLYIIEVRGERPVKDSEGYFIKGLHHIEKRHVFGVETFSKPSGSQSKGQTVIIVPSGGQNYPSNSYPSNPHYGDNGANKETTVVVTSSDNNNGNNKYRG